MSGMRSVTVFPVQSAPQNGPVQIDYNQQLQDLIDSSNQVLNAVENIDTASPVDLTPVLTAINTQTSLIDTFKQQSDANQISTKVAVDTVKTAVDQLKATVESESQLLQDAIAQASADEQANLNASLTATVGALQTALVSEFNESQVILTEQSQKLTTIANALTGGPEVQLSVAENIDTSEGAKEIVLPGGWTQGDIGPNFLTAAGAVSTEGAEFSVEIGGKTETVLMNGEWHREPRVGFMGKSVPTLGARIVIKQAPSTTHVVFSYPQSQSPAGIVATPVSDGGVVLDDATIRALLEPIAGRLIDESGAAPVPPENDLLGLLDMIEDDGLTFEQLGSDVSIGWLNDVGVTQALTADQFDAIELGGRGLVQSILVNNHANLVPMVENLYNLSDGAGYQDDLSGLNSAIRGGASFADVVSGANAVRIDIDGDGAGDREVTQFEYDQLAVTQPWLIGQITN